MIKIEKWKGVYTFEDSPYIMEILTMLRDRNTNSIEFRKGLVEMGRYMGYELVKTMPVENIVVDTPLESTEGILIRDRRNTVIITILRAAIPFMEGLIKVFEHSRVGIISASRGKAPDFKIDMRYVKIPKINGQDTPIIPDPMIATGSTVLRVLEEMKSYGEPKRKIVLGILAAPQGIENIKFRNPDVEIFVAKIDRELDEGGYILPGLGDAGDRAFGSPMD